MQLDTTGWSGDGAFTQRLLDSISRFEEVAFVRVEDSPAARSDVDYNFISNEIFLAFRTAPRVERSRWLGCLPRRRRVEDKSLTLTGVEELLAADGDVGRPDYADGTMLQYLRTERIVPPYQTRGYKLVELVRIYEVGTERLLRRQP
jgi:hypothetical protein